MATQFIHLIQRWILWYLCIFILVPLFSLAGYLGSLASALFTALAVQRVPLELWGLRLLESLPVALEYIRSTGKDAECHVEVWDYFRESWER